MSKNTKYLIGIFIAALIGLQFFSGKRPEVRQENPNDLITNVTMDQEVAEILRTSCYDCHSMETKYPWYTMITPVNGVIYHHIEEGRQELNFSEWTDLPARKKIRKLKELAEEVDENKMPLSSYTLIHGNATLSDDQKTKLINWANTLSESILAD